MIGDDEIDLLAEPIPARRTFLGRRGCIGAAAGMLLLLVVIVLLLPAISPGREAARRLRCRQKLENIMVAMNCYRAKYGCYPPAYTVDKHGCPMHSWRTLLLEFLDHELYVQYDLKRPWNTSCNLDVAKKMKKDGPYRCSSEYTDDPSWTSYVVIVGPTTFSDGSWGRRPDEITDGPENTIAVVEMSPSGIVWTARYDLNVAEMSFKINDPDQSGLRSNHSSIVHVLFADGHVSALNEHDPDIEVLLKALVTINGGEDMSKYPRD